MAPATKGRGAGSSGSSGGSGKGQRTNKIPIKAVAALLLLAAFTCGLVYQAILYAQAPGSNSDVSAGSNEDRAGQGQSNMVNAKPNSKAAALAKRMQEELKREKEVVVGDKTYHPSFGIFPKGCKWRIVTTKGSKGVDYQVRGTRCCFCNAHPLCVLSSSSPIISTQLIHFTSGSNIFYINSTVLEQPFQELLTPQPFPSSHSSHFNPLPHNAVLGQRVQELG